MAATQLADIVEPTEFENRIQQITETKSRLITSGAAARQPFLDASLSRGGRIDHLPTMRDLDDTVAANIPTDGVYDDIDGTGHVVPQKLQMEDMIFGKIYRNQVWAANDFALALAGDPSAARSTVQNRSGTYVLRDMERDTLSTVQGVFANNDLAAGSGGGDGDLTNDVTGTFSAGTTDIKAEHVIDTLQLVAGDSANDVALMVCHSRVFANLQKKNLIDFIPDSNGLVNFANYLTMTLIVTDRMPVSSGDYDTYFFGRGALMLGMGSEGQNAARVVRHEEAGNGAGEERMYVRWRHSVVPFGFSWTPASAPASPAATTAANQLGHQDSWSRLAGFDSKMSKMARLRTTEHA